MENRTKLSDSSNLELIAKFRRIRLEALAGENALLEGESTDEIPNIIDNLTSEVYRAREIWKETEDTLPQVMGQGYF